jgi:hypothetical protein
MLVVKRAYQNRWGPLRQVHVPNAVFQEDVLALPAPSLAVLIALLYVNKGRKLSDLDIHATVRVGTKRLSAVTGYSKNMITEAIQELKSSCFLESEANRRKRGEFGTSEYVFCNPSNGEFLQPGRNLTYTNKLPYFTVPICFVKEQAERWSLAKVTGSELKLYATLLYLANRYRSNEFTSSPSELRRMSGLSSPTFKKAAAGIENHGLVWLTTPSDKWKLSVCDPHIGTPIDEQTGDNEDDPANYYTVGAGGRSKRLILNKGDADAIENLVVSCLPEDQTSIRQGNGDLMIVCPFHADRNPSCSVSPSKNGCFHCFGCGEYGGLVKLTEQLQGISRGEAIRKVAKAVGQECAYHEPDKNALAIYSYRNEKGTLLKQVLRYPDRDGKKRFGQRRPAKGGGWIWDVEGVVPSLFNLEHLDFGNVVCITEGEKDANSVTDLHLMGSYGPVVGTTSGGSDSWHPSLARYLRQKRVVLMPDADDAGARFAAAVQQSLDADGIGYRIVTFGDAGAKDVTDFLAENRVEDLVRRIGIDWVRMPGGRRLEEMPFATATINGEIEDAIAI